MQILTDEVDMNNSHIHCKQVHPSVVPIDHAYRAVDTTSPLVEQASTAFEAAQIDLEGCGQDARVHRVNNGLGGKCMGRNSQMRNRSVCPCGVEEWTAFDGVGCWRTGRG
jgi:hypothetical protein